MVDKKVAEILLVEDDRIAAQVTKILLENVLQDVVVTVVATGKDAVEIMQTKKFDLVLLDLGLPDISGFDVAKQILSWPESQQAPIVALTASYGDDLYKELLSIGFKDLISKPLTKHSCKKLIKYLPSYQESSPVDKIKKPIIDIEFLKNNLNVDFETIRGMIKMLVDDLPNISESINKALFNDDFKTIADIAHRLCGSSLYCGIKDLNSIASEIEALSQKELVAVDRLVKLIYELDFIIENISVEYLRLFF